MLVFYKIKILGYLFRFLYFLKEGGVICLSGCPANVLDRKSKAFKAATTFSTFSGGEEIQWRPEEFADDFQYEPGSVKQNNPEHWG